MHYQGQTCAKSLGKRDH